MGLRGPAPKPTILKVIEGNPGKQKLNHREPQPYGCAPEMLKHLNRIARKEWKRLVPILLSMRVLTEADGIALANLCQAYSTLVEANELMAKAAAGGKSPLLMKTPAGYMQQSPLLGIINSQMDIINRQLREFGLTPASRSRLVAASDSTSIDPLEAKLCGRPISA